MISDFVNTWSSGTIDLLKQNYNRLGLKASGNWANELEVMNKVTQENINIKFLGSQYTGVLVSGRKHNTNQDKTALQKWVGWAGSTFLKDWVAQKGIKASPFAIAWKIAREGIKVPNAHNAGGLVSDVINDKRIQVLLDDLKIFFVDDIKSNIIK